MGTNSLAFGLGLESLSIDALCISKKSLAMIAASSEFTVTCDIVVAAHSRWNQGWLFFSPPPLCVYIYPYIFSGV